MLSTLVAVSAIVCAGLVAGALLGDRVAASQARARLDAANFVTFMQTWHTHFVRFVGPLMLIGVVAGGGWLVLAWPHGNWIERALIAAAIAGLVTVSGITATVNVPINGQLMTWNAAAPPADLAARWAPWEAAHTARAIVAATVLVLDAVALGL
jgi:hypothetical protein